MQAARHAAIAANVPTSESPAKKVWLGEACDLCKTKYESGTGVGCGGVCTFRPPTLTEADPELERRGLTPAVKRDLFDFSFYAVHGFKHELLPADFQYDASSQTVKGFIKTAEIKLRSALHAHADSILHASAGMSLGTFRKAFDIFCEPMRACRSDIAFILPKSFLVPADQKATLSSLIYALAEERYFSWHAEHGKDPYQGTHDLHFIAARPEVRPACPKKIYCYETGVCIRCATNHEGTDVCSCSLTQAASSVPAKRRKVYEDRDTCVESPGHFKKWLREGRLHRDYDLPACIEYNERGTTLSYLREGLPYRCAASFPHVWHKLKEIRCKCVGKGTECECGSTAAGDQYVWLDRDAKPHRDHDLPAVVGPGRFKQWYFHGMLHRPVSIGPAQITGDGKASYYENDCEITHV